MTLPPDYPHDMTDENLEQHVRAYMAMLSTTDVNMVMSRAPLVQIGQVELQLRAGRALRDAIGDFETTSRASSDDLYQAIDDFKKASDRAAGRLAFATWVLVGLTVALLGATIALIVHAA